MVTFFIFELLSSIDFVQHPAQSLTPVPLILISEESSSITLISSCLVYYHHLFLSSSFPLVIQLKQSVDSKTFSLALLISYSHVPSWTIWISWLILIIPLHISFNLFGPRSFYFIIYLSVTQPGLFSANSATAAGLLNVPGEKHSTTLYWSYYHLMPTTLKLVFKIFWQAICVSSPFIPLFIYRSI